MANYKDAARKSGLNFSQWVKSTLDNAAKEQKG
jgi:hypothetical protein